MLASPGDDYVDWIGIDGYNWGTNFEWSSWTEFNRIFRPMYDRLSKEFPDKPIMIPEISCHHHGGNHAEWISHLPQQLNEFPNIRAIAWFDAVLEIDFRAAATQKNAQAWKQIMNEKNFKSDFRELWAVE